MIYPGGRASTPLGADAPDDDASRTATSDEPTEQWFDIEGRPLHAYVAAPTTETVSGGGAAVLPGLGLPQYTLPMAMAVAALGLRCTVLDLPGFGSGAPDATRSSIHAIGCWAAQWMLAQPEGSVTVLVGHSTGAQAALTTALAIQHARPATALVLAGPTFVPRQRRLLPLAAATLTAYRRDSLRELVVAPSLARGRLGVVQIVRSGMRDRPDERVRRLTVPLTLTSGEADTYAPRWWLERLAQAAVASPHVDVETLPGSHNNLFTHPGLIAETVHRAATGRGLPPDGAG